MRIAGAQALNLNRRIRHANNNYTPAIALPPALKEKRDIEHDSPVPAQIRPYHLLVHFLADRGVHDAIEDFAVVLLLRAGSEDAAPEGGAVERAAGGRGFGFWHEEVGGAGQEVRDDCVVAGGPGLDDLSRD